MVLLSSIAVVYIVVIKPPSNVIAKPVPTSLHGIRVPVGYLGPVGQIKIDAYPVDELIALKNEAGEKLDVPGSQETPLVLLVAPGSYVIELEKATCRIEVAEEQQRWCRKIVRTVDAAAFYREVGW